MLENSFQFYPTPPSLALKAWAKFKNRQIERLLEPSAGTGNLVKALTDHNHDLYSRKDYAAVRAERLPFMKKGNKRSWDAIEINPSFHPQLREIGATVIGYDFLSFQNGAQFSHIIMNPPFMYGVTHLLHAWDILFEGEIVAIIGAETLRNPCSKERQLLVNLIDEHGSVEFLEDEFLTEETERKTAVEIALVHLKKEGMTNQDLLHYLSDLTKREQESVNMVGSTNEVALPNNFIENAVINYNLAISASLEAQIALKKANLYASRLNPKANTTTEEVCLLEEEASKLTTSLLANQHQSIHEKAWSMIIESTITTRHLSEQTAKRVEKDLELIYELAFNATNIYGFVSGLVSQRGEIQKEMVLEVFDKITRYHSENQCYYLGWKSNDKHRTVGRSIKMSRFILPLGSDSYYSKHKSVKTLQDIENTCLMLDGKVNAEVSLFGLYDSQETYERLCQGERLSSDYFDIRFYPSRGTMHFFPKRADVIRRLNVYVGKARQWLPEDINQASESFINQFDQAEKVSKGFDIKKELNFSSSCLARALDDGDKQSMDSICALIEKSQADLGIALCLETGQQYQAALLT